MNAQDAEHLIQSFPIQAYLDYCDLYKLNPYQSDPEILNYQLYYYVVYRMLFLKGTDGSARADVGQIEKYLALEGIHSDVRPWKPLAHLLSSLKYYRPSKAQVKRAFRESELILIFDKIKPTSVSALIIRTFLAFAVCGALRASEYTARRKNPAPIDAFNVVKLRRIHKFIDETGNQSLIYLFFRSKRNRTWKTEYAVMPCCCSEGLPCAYHELERLEKHIKNLNQDTYLFTWPNGSLLTYDHALKICKAVSASIGASWEDIGTHSARKARTVMAARRRLSAHELLLIGRWKRLESVIPYLQMSPLQFSSFLSGVMGTNTHSSKL